MVGKVVHPSGPHGHPSVPRTRHMKSNADRSNPTHTHTIDNINEDDSVMKNIFKKDKSVIFSSDGNISSM